MRVVMSFAVRVWGSGFGLPYMYIHVHTWCVHVCNSHWSVSTRHHQTTLRLCVAEGYSSAGRHVLMESLSSAHGWLWGACRFLSQQTMEAHISLESVYTIDSVNETNHILNDHPFDSQDLRIRTVDSCSTSILAYADTRKKICSQPRASAKDTFRFEAQPTCVQSVNWPETSAPLSLASLVTRSLQLCGCSTADPGSFHVRCSGRFSTTCTQVGMSM